ncbi:MAG: FAD-dependent oxidoreductase [Dehalococcoidia bacterium]|nr:MAG: FAD-dependent oxidoreductase [Dehalococcoidia bacterium]
MAKRLIRLFEPINIGGIELKNRIKLPAMGITFEEDAKVSEQTKAFYAARAKGGVGLIGISCSTTRLDRGPLFGIYDDSFIPGLSELADVVHDNGAKVYAQIGVGYSWAFDNGPIEFISPSGITPTGQPGSAFRLGGPHERTMPKALTVEEIHHIVDTFGDCANRARQCGFDAVEIIASVSYIISQFLSPLTNKREDEYGGSLENRMRLLLEIIDDIKNKAGSDFPITCRLSGADLMEPKGYDLEDTKVMARMLEAAGVCQIDVMAGWHYASVPMIQMWVPQGAWVYLAEGVKSAVNIPVAAGTQIQDPLVAEKVIFEGSVDMVYMARALVADPELPNKAREGRLDDIVPCINCCRCISGVDDPPIYCSVNARVGREAEFPYEKAAADKKKVLVVGGGPSGMEAARIASLRGHKVTLCEQNTRLGGALLIAAITNKRLVPLLNYMKRVLSGLPIELKLNTRVTPSMVSKLKPDVVLLATGGTTSQPHMSMRNRGIILDRTDIQRVFSGQPMESGVSTRKTVSFVAALFIRYLYSPSLIRWLLRFNFPFGKNVVVTSGNFAGCELADTLNERGKQVTIIEESSRIGSDIEITHRWVFLDRLKKAGTHILKNARIIEIRDNGVEVESSSSREFIEADTVANIGITANNELVQELDEQVLELYNIGDSAEPGKIMEAMASGFLIGQRI